MLDGPRQHIGDGLDPPVRVPGKAGEVFFGPFRPEVVEHQERVEERELAVPECPVEPDAGTFDTKRLVSGPAAADLKSSAPRQFRRLNSALDQARAASIAKDQVALGSAQGEAIAALRFGAYRTALAMTEADRPERAKAWLQVRDFRPTTRYSRPAVEATDALNSLADGDMTPEEAATLVNKDLLDTYQARVRIGLEAAATAEDPARVINIGSLAGRMGGFETGLGYSASKGGINALTMGFARQLAPLNINVNAVCPGTTETPITREFTPEALEKLYARVPLGRLGKPEDVAAAVAYLASDDAAFVTGVLLDVNGGMYMG